MDMHRLRKGGGSRHVPDQRHRAQGGLIMHDFGRLAARQLTFWHRVTAGSKCVSVCSKYCVLQRDSRAPAAGVCWCNDHQTCCPTGEARR